MLEDYLLRNNLITALWYWNPWQQAKEKNTKLILITLRGFLSWKGIQCSDYLVLLLILLPCLPLSFQIFQSQKKDFRFCVKHASQTVSPDLKGIRLGLRKSWGTLWKGDEVRWGLKRGSGLMDRKRHPREAEKPRANEGVPEPLPSAYLKDIPPFEAQLVIRGGFEVVLGDGFHAGAAAHGGAGAGKEALPRSLRSSRGPAPSETPAPSLTYREPGGRSALGEEEEETGH